MEDGFETGNIPVQLSIPLKQDFTQGEDGDLYLEFLGSNTSLSLSGHMMEESAIKNMKEQAVGLPMFVNHDPDKVFAVIDSVRETGPDEFRPIAKVFSQTGDSIVDEPTNTVRNWLKQGVDLGASIGAVIKKYKIIIDEDAEDDFIIDISKVELIETSATPIPAVQDTKGQTKAVKCKDGMCSQMVKEILKQDKSILKPVEVIKEEITMAEEVKVDNKYKQLEEKIAAMELKEAKLEEARLAQEAKEAKKVEKEELKTEILGAVKETVKEQFDIIVKEMKADRTEVPGVVKETANGELPDVKEVKTNQSVVGQVFTKPEEYPAHLGGVKQTAYTSEQLAQMA
jgi:hypothetical protein